MKVEAILIKTKTKHGYNAQLITRKRLNPGLLLELEDLAERESELR